MFHLHGVLWDFHTISGAVLGELVRKTQEDHTPHLDREVWPVTKRFPVGDIQHDGRELLHQQHRRESRA